MLVDSSAIPGLRLDPTLGGRIRPGERPIISFVSIPEMRNAIGKPGSNLRGVPGIARSLPQLDSVPSLNTRIGVRGFLPAGRGRFGDGIIGGQALENNIPLITNDRNLGDAVRSLGGIVR